MVKIKDKLTGLFEKPHLICVYTCSISKNFLKEEIWVSWGNTPLCKPDFKLYLWGRDMGIS